jgi:YebC/PmpR family DNA-binding regulatory protein
MSGHSKWSQIKHKKGAADAKRGKLFSKLAREITLAARAGSPDPTMNAPLRAVVERARTQGLPKDNIERAIARASGAGDSVALEEFLYAALGPGGVTILIEGITDNKNRSLAEIKQLLIKHEARLADPGSVLWNYEKIGIVEINAEQNRDKNKDVIELAIIESGARDFQVTNEGPRAETEFTARDATRRALEANSVTVKDTGHDYKPRARTAVSSESRAVIETLLDTLLEHDDVQEVYTNLNE